MSWTEGALKSLGRTIEETCKCCFGLRGEVIRTVRVFMACVRSGMNTVSLK